jgi:hypothetical protein
MVRPLVVAGFWLAAQAALALTLTLNGWWALPAVVLVALAALGTWDLVQRPHTILRSYPIVGHLPFLMEYIRPEIRQYFVESNTEASPFDREARDMVYERAKGTQGEEPFGTERDVTAIGHEFLGIRCGRGWPRISPRGSGWAAPTAPSLTTSRC